MRHFNWLIKRLFYKHEDKKADPATLGTGVFYAVSYMDQKHANLCTDASSTMLDHFAGQPFASMAKNPRGILEGSLPDKCKYTVNNVNTSNLELLKRTIQDTLKNNGPCIISIPLKAGAHSVVMIGCDADTIIYHDPMMGPNKVISFSELKRICDQEAGGYKSILEIAIPPSYNLNFSEKRKDTMNLQQEMIYSTKHAKHFTIKKMEDPCQAIKDFLNDYAKNSFWRNRTHRKEVKDFLVANKNVSDLGELVRNMETVLPNTHKGELSSRLSAVKQFMNMNKSDEMKGAVSSGRSTPEGDKDDHQLRSQSRI